MEALTLYGYWRSSSSWRVRIGLELKGLAYETVPVHLVKNEQRDEAFIARSPLGQVPVLAWNEGGVTHQLTQSMAILQFLDAVVPEPPLLPQSPLLRARALEASEIINAGIQPLQNLRMLMQIERWGGDRKAFGAEVIARGFNAVEQVIVKSRGEFAVGERPTIADCCLIPQIYNARRFGVDLEPFPTIRRVDAACSQVDAFRRSHPDLQPDAQS
ncbi:MAG: maleylacetoacetate isomerase [Myxococcota bacterium]